MSTRLEAAAAWPPSFQCGDDRDPFGILSLCRRALRLPNGSWQSTPYSVQWIDEVGSAPCATAIELAHSCRWQRQARCVLAQQRVSIAAMRWCGQTSEERRCSSCGPARTLACARFRHSAPNIWPLMIRAVGPITRPGADSVSPRVAQSWSRARCRAHDRRHAREIREICAARARA